jgi:predicted O-methyltransferase YrrM
LTISTIFVKCILHYDEKHKNRIYKIDIGIINSHITIIQKKINYLALAQFPKMKISNAFFRVKKYFAFRRKAKTAFSVHSPFLYELYQTMRKPEFNKKEDKKKLDGIRTKFSQCCQTLSFDDPGAKGGHIKTKAGMVFKRTSKPLKQSLAISAAAANIQSKEILELGTAFGTTSLTLQLLNPEARVTTMEGVPEIAEYAHKAFNETGVSTIDSRIGLFKDLLPEYLNEGRKIDFVFMDGHHKGDASKEYIDMLYPALSDIAIIAIDDIYYSPDMVEFWEEIQKDERFQASLDFFHFGLLIKNENLQKMNFTLKI